MYKINLFWTCTFSFNSEIAFDLKNNYNCNKRGWAAALYQENWLKKSEEAYKLLF